MKRLFNCLFGFKITLLKGKEFSFEFGWFWLGSAIYLIYKFICH